MAKHHTKAGLTSPLSTAVVASCLQVCTDASSVHDAGVAPAPIQEKQQQQCISDPLKSLKLKQMLGLVSSAQQLYNRASPRS
jgi:hypothetical protein